MSKIGNYVLAVQEIVDPMVYNGASNAAIIKAVKAICPDAPDMYIQQKIIEVKLNREELEVHND